ncbi:hypothetical protein Tsp_00106 [Trichinella spiralis]|uniref:hypothetical protein n=1 Tax=Trichinella spiralis TaxID=6334 RepID=UPI0001EFBE42|nr:hypothetical protein Tsp_00106 [Trichinella spiralis]
MLACLLACLFTAAPVTRQSITAIKLCESTLVLASGERQNFPLVPTLIPASTHCRRYLVTKDWSAVWTFDVVLFYLLPPTIYELSLHPERLSSPSIQTVQQSSAKMREGTQLVQHSTIQFCKIETSLKLRAFSENVNRRQLLWINMINNESCELGTKIMHDVVQSSLPHKLRMTEMLNINLYFEQFELIS